MVLTQTNIKPDSTQHNTYEFCESLQIARWIHVAPQMAHVLVAEPEFDTQLRWNTATKSVLIALSHHLLQIHSDQFAALQTATFRIGGVENFVGWNSRVRYSFVAACQHPDDHVWNCALRLNCQSAK